MKIGMIFPGYASQFVGMGKELYDESRIVQEYFEEASNCLNMNFVKLCFASSDAELSRMENAYPAIFLVSTALCALLKNEGMSPILVAGYSTGELSAMHAAGDISFPDGLYLLAKSGVFYQDLLQGLDVAGLRITGLSTKQVQSLCNQVTTDGVVAHIAFFDTPVQHIVMGHTQAIEHMRELASASKGVQISDAPVELGLHSPLMDSVVSYFKLYLEKVDFKDLIIPLATDADAKIVTQGDRVKAALVKQINSPVQWHKVISLFDECDVIVEVGPGTHLTTMLQTQYPEKKSLSINKRADVNQLKKLVEQQQAQAEG